MISTWFEHAERASRREAEVHIVRARGCVDRREVGKFDATTVNRREVGKFDASTVDRRDVGKFDATTVEGAGGAPSFLLEIRHAAFCLEETSENHVARSFGDVSLRAPGEDLSY